MGYIKHNAVVCTTYSKEYAVQANKKAKEIFEKYEVGFEKLVSEILEYVINTGYSFFIAPDGSKEGWETSNKCNDARKEFLNWIEESNNHCDFIEVTFGGDDKFSEINRINT